MTRIRIRLSSGRRLDRLHCDVLDAMDKALEAADPSIAIRRHATLENEKLRVDALTYRLRRYRRIFVIGAGKATARMAQAMETMLGDRIAAGLVIVPDYLHPLPRNGRIRYHQGSHPIPSRKNVEGVVEMLRLVENPGRDNLVLTLISGGASALMDYPVDGVTLEDEKQTTSLLLKSGARIQEVNAVRKHISRVKGGRLARMLEPAQILTLIVSDVIGDEIDAIGSGPTAADPTTYHDARQILKKYGLWSRIPSHVQHVIDKGTRGVLPETPKPGARTFQRVKNVIVGSNRESCSSAMEHMRSAGYDARILSTSVIGEAREAGRILASIITEVHDRRSLLSLPAALILGGETTVTVKGKGRGGRNQELALSAAVEIAGYDKIVLGSLATDGVDGPTDAAGALVDGTTASRARRLRMDPEAFLDNNDSYNYFARLGSLVKTGPTGTNVNDITIMAAE